MKTFIVNNWKTLLIIILAVLIGVILTRSCRSKPDTGSGVSIDSLENENVASQAKYARLSDSLQVVIAEKDLTAVQLVKTLNSITAKYRLLINREPSHDTVVQTVEVFTGRECLEKMPIMEQALILCNSEIEDYKELVIVKTNQNNSLQGQFDRALSISRIQEDDLKKANRKIKWLKIGIITESVVLLGAAIFVLAK